MRRRYPQLQQIDRLFCLLGIVEVNSGNGYVFFIAAGKDLNNFSAKTFFGLPIGHDKDFFAPLVPEILQRLKINDAAAEFLIGKIFDFLPGGIILIISGNAERSEEQSELQSR